MQFVTVEIKDSIALLTINRPKVLNALNTDVFNELKHFLENIALQEKVRAVILTGAGEKAFIAGADIKEMQGMNQEQIAEYTKLGQDVANILETAPFVTIAAVNGYALGGGLEMALACDFAYASSKASFGMPEVSLGLIPGFGGTQRLTDALGQRQAKEWIMSGRMFKAEEVFRLGVVNRVCNPAVLLSECFATAQEILKHSFTAVLAAKNAINCGAMIGYTAAFELERNIFAACFDTVERKKAMQEFTNRR